jgi:UbiD family decarboxylase
MAEADQRGTAILFERVQATDAAVAYNLLGSREALALALRVEADEVVRAFAERSRRRIPPVVVQGPAPAQEVVRTHDADLRRLPLILHSERDAGPYITAGMVIARDPQSGRRNVSFNRMMIDGPRDAGIRMMPPQQLGVIQARAEAEGRDLEVAVAIGLHPLDLIAGATSLPMGDDELALAGALREEPIRMAHCQTVDLEVPAQAEIVLEGAIRAGVREPEGPFGDFLHYYVPVTDNHRFALTAITHRRKPVMQTMYAGSREDVQLLGVSRAALIAQAVERAGIDLCAIDLGPTILGCTLAIRPQYAGEAKAVAMAAFGAYRWLKYCVVVDPDVNVHDPADVCWALTTRTRLADDIVVIPDAGGFPRDEHGVFNDRLIIDATIPQGDKGGFLRRRPPGAGHVRWEDYLE